MISIIVSGINLIITGYIADESNLPGDIMSSNMFLIILGLILQLDSLTRKSAFFDLG